MQKKRLIKYVVGDKLSDLEPAKICNAKSIFVTWGHASGGEKEVADFVVHNSQELLEIIQRK